LRIAAKRMSKGCRKIMKEKKEIKIKRADEKTCV